MSNPFRAASVGIRTATALSLLGLALATLPAAALDPIRPPQPLSAPG